MTLNPGRERESERQTIQALARIVRLVESCPPAVRNRLEPAIAALFVSHRPSPLPQATPPRPAFERIPAAQTRTRITDALRGRPGMTPMAVALEIGEPPSPGAVKKAMWDMAREGVLVSERGRYWLRDAGA